MTDHNNASPASASTARESSFDEEVYGALGSLLGTLEVIATDDHHPLPAVQVQRMRSALQLGNAMQAQIEALLLLSDPELGARLRRHSMAMRPMIEHAVRSALRSFESGAVALVLPSGDAWGQQRVSVDTSRVDRSVRALAEQLAQRVGDGGVVEVALQQVGSQVQLILQGRAGAVDPRAKRSALIAAGARRLFELHGGGLSIDASGLNLVISLPAAE